MTRSYFNISYIRWMPYKYHRFISCPLESWQENVCKRYFIVKVSIKYTRYKALIVIGNKIRKRWWKNLTTEWLLIAYKTIGKRLYLALKLLWKCDLSSWSYVLTFLWKFILPVLMHLVVQTYRFPCGTSTHACTCFKDDPLAPSLSSSLSLSSPSPLPMPC